jgi:hypothetical protein
MFFLNLTQRRGAKVYIHHRLWTAVNALLAAALLSLGCAPAVWSYRPTDVSLRTPITAPTRLSVRVDGAPSQAEADELAASIKQDLQTNAFPNTVEENPNLDVSIDVAVRARTGFPYGCLSIDLWLLGVPLGKRYGRSEITAFVADATGTRLARYTAVNEQGALYGVVLGVPYGCWNGEDQIPAATAAAIDGIKQDIARDRSRLAKALLQAPTQPIDTAAAAPQVHPSPSLPAPGTIRLSELVGDTIDLPERDRYELFPGIVGFQWAVVSSGPDSLLVATVVRVSRQVPETLRLRLTAGDVERVTFLVQNPELVRSQAEQNEDARVALVLFWDRVESNLVAVAPPAHVQPKPTKPRPADVLPWAVRGAGVGAAAGGIGASAAVAGMPGEWRVLESQRACYEACNTCLGSGMLGPCISPFAPTPVYAIDQAAFCGIAGSATIVGSVGGAVAGALLPARPPQERVPRTPTGTLMIVLGTLLGTGAGLGAGVGATALCRSIAESGPDPKETDLEVMYPGAAVGAAITYEVIRTFTRIADAIDRRAAASRHQENPEIRVRPTHEP